MSHPHTHAPGEQCNHNHAPNTPLPTLDRASQAVIDSDFKPVNLDLNADNTQIVCAPHKLEKCAQCDLDFVNTNRLAKLFVINPTLRCSPPSNVISHHLSKAITNTKEEGNVRKALLASVSSL
jgi:translocation protein SEC72